MRLPSRTTALPALLLLLPACLPITVQEDIPVSPPEHAPIFSVTAGTSVPVSVSFEDPAGLAEVRLYFKTMSADHYLFLPMTGTGRGTYTANLPPARNWTKGIDYLLLRRSTGGEIRKSRPFRLLVMNDFGTSSPAAGEMEARAEDAAARGKNNDFAVPLEVSVTEEPLLARALEDPYPPISLAGPGSGSSGLFGGLGGMSFSVQIDGVSICYGSFSGR